jgi:hypothetical protein
MQILAAKKPKKNTANKNQNTKTARINGRFLYQSLSAGTPTAVSGGCARHVNQVLLG